MLADDRRGTDIDKHDYEGLYRIYSDPTYFWYKVPITRQNGEHVEKYELMVSFSPFHRPLPKVDRLPMLLLDSPHASLPILFSP